MKVINISENVTTPRQVLDSVTSQLPDIKDIYVIAFSNDNEPMSWASGDLESMPRAAVYFTALTTDVIFDKADD